MTLTDVARKAGTSRMTVYRRFPDVDTLLRELMTREFSGVIEASKAAGHGLPHARARLVAEIVTASRAMHDNALFQRVLDVDPELLVPYLVNGLGSTQRRAVEMFREGIEHGHADGSVRAGAAQRLAYGMLLPVQSFVLSARAMAPGASVEETGEELGALLDSYLAPVGEASSHDTGKRRADGWAYPGREPAWEA